MFDNWNADNLEWRLLENTAEILRFKDASGRWNVIIATDALLISNILLLGDYLIDKIRDAAAQKGTGKWAVIEAFNAGVPITVITESVSTRFVSAMKEDRVKASNRLVGPQFHSFDGNRESFIDDIRKVRTQKKIWIDPHTKWFLSLKAVHASKIILYAQGFMLLQESLPRLFGCHLNCADLAQMWRGGCVIKRWWHVNSIYNLKISNVIPIHF